MFGAFAPVMREENEEGQLGTRDLDHAACGRAHVTAFISPRLLLPFHLGLLSGRSKGSEALALRATGILHNVSPDRRVKEERNLACRVI
jgi:hypothetical protein